MSEEGKVRFRYVTVSSYCHDGAWTRITGWRGVVARFALHLFSVCNKGARCTVATTYGTDATTIHAMVAL